MGHHTENKKLLIVIPRFLPIVGGAEMFAFRLSRMLKSDGVNILVLTSRFLQDCLENEIMDGIKVARVGRPGGQRSLDWIARLPYFIVKERKNFYSMLIIGIDFHAFFSAITGKLLGKKIFIRPATGKEDFSLNAPDLSLFFSKKIYRFFFKVSKWLMIKLLPIFVDGWIAISREIEREMKNAGVDDKKIKHIPNGVDTEIFCPVDQSTKRGLREAFSIPVNATVLMFCGRLVRRKGVDLLLRVFGMLSSLYPELHLLLVGSGEHQMDSIEEDVIRFKNIELFRDRITWITNSKDMPKYYQVSDIFILPSRREGMPNVLLEAMASGLPCICSSIGGIVDLIEDPKNGMLFANAEELQNTIVKLLEHKELHEYISFSARETIVRCYDLKIITEAYKNFLFP
jgi:glycosyltransferase involved in cell wall biosynthesis